jgi:hypothetical protein
MISSAQKLNSNEKKLGRKSDKGNKKSAAGVTVVAWVKRVFYGEHGTCILFSNLFLSPSLMTDVDVIQE